MVSSGYQLWELLQGLEANRKETMTKTAQTYTRIYINGKPIDLKQGDTIEYQEDDFEVESKKD